MKGYIPCAVLAELEKRANKPVSEMFDMYAGTSIGGILASLFASGHTATEALEFFTVDGPLIFKKRWFNFTGLLRPRYGADVIEERLKLRFKDTKLSDCKKALVVPTFDVASYTPYFFKNPLREDADYYLWQAARATSAAQTYFPGFKLDERVLWDGGNIANNPSACALAEAVRMWGWKEDFKILSLSCGAKGSVFTAKNLMNAGLIHAGVETMNLLFEANDQLPDYILSHLLEDAYTRIEPPLGLVRDLEMDGASEADLEKLSQVAKQTIAAIQPKLDRFIFDINSPGSLNALRRSYSRRKSIGRRSVRGGSSQA